MYEAIRSELFQLVNDPLVLSNKAVVDDAFWVQWIDLTNWRYTQPIGKLDLTLTVCLWPLYPTLHDISTMKMTRKKLVAS